MRIGRYVLIVFIFLLFSLSGCGSKELSRGDSDGTRCADLQRLPQDLVAYAAKADPNKPLLSPLEHGKHTENTIRRHYQPWRTTTAPAVKDALWGFFYLKPERAFIAPNRPFPQDEWDRLIKNCDRNSYPSRIAHAVTVANTALRAMPTNMPFYHNPRMPGEGYPFDYLQHTALWIGTPLLIVHASADGQWMLAVTGIASGWVHARDIAFVDEQFTALWQSLPLAAIIDDNVPLQPDKDASTDSRDRVGHIGVLLPMRAHNNNELSVLYPTTGTGQGASFVATILTPKQAVPFPLLPTPGAVAEVGNRMMGQPYGWGGLDEKRDCSSMMRDLFLPFGLSLPRNSARQAAWGRPVDLRGLSPEAKEQKIMAEGVPFFSLIWLKGHIGLYLGAYEGKPVMFHNIWGLRIRVPDGQGSSYEGRAVIGKAVVTTLQPGREFPNISSPASILDRIERLSILPETSRKVPVVKPAKPIRKTKRPGRR